MKRVIVLGSKGFIGSHLVKALEKDNVEVLGFSSKEINLLAADSAEALAAKLRPEDSLVLVSALTPDKGRDLGTLIQNLTMVNNVLAALKKAKVAHLVAISSDAVFDDNATLVGDATLRAPGTFHGIMHLARETALTQGCKELQIPLMIVRPSAVYGPGDTHRGYGPNRFLVTALESGEIALFGGGEEKRDHVFIDDVIGLISLTLKKQSTGSINAVSGTAVSFMDVAKAVQESLKASKNKEVVIKTSARQNPITHKHFDITELAATFPGFRMTPLKAGVEKTVREVTK